MLSPALHRPPDPENSRDPRIRALVTRLRSLDETETRPAPEPGFRDELRAQLVAIAPRIVAEGERPARRRPSPGASRRAAQVDPAPATRARPRRRVRLGRPLAVVAGVLTVFALLLGGAVWISQRALPGDALYGLKRASENVQESLSGSDTDRAKLQLQFAKTRYDEVLALLPDAKTATEPSSQTSSLIDTALSSADSDLTSAMRTLGAKAVQDKSGKDLAVVANWATKPIAQLKVKAFYLPAGAVQNRMFSSWKLLVGAKKQAGRVSELTCSACVARLPTNELGPYVPKDGPPPAKSHGSAHHGTTGTGGTTTSSPSPTAESGSAGTQPSTAAAVSSAPGGSGAESSPAAGGLPGLLPSLPAEGLPSQSQQSCPGVDLGVISVGNCGIAVDPSP